MPASPFRRAYVWARDLYLAMQRARTFGLAAETAFWIFLAIIPLAAVAGLLAARFSTHNWEEVSPVLAPFPWQTRAFIANELLKVSNWNGGTVGFTSAVVFLWLGSSGIHAILDALETESWHPRPYWKRRALALVACVGLSVAVAVLAILGPAFPVVFDDASEPTIVARIVRVLGSLLISFGYVAGLYWVGVPKAARDKMPLWPGVTITVVLQTALSFGYSTYISKMGGGGAYTAGLYIIGLTMMAIYLFVIALLVGAVVNRRIAEARGVLEELRDDPRYSRNR